MIVKISWTFVCSSSIRWTCCCGTATWCAWSSTSYHASSSGARTPGGSVAYLCLYVGGTRANICPDLVVVIYHCLWSSLDLVLSPVRRNFEHKELKIPKNSGLLLHDGHWNFQSKEKFQQPLYRTYFENTLLFFCFFTDEDLFISIM